MNQSLFNLIYRLYLMSKNALTALIILYKQREI